MLNVNKKGKTIVKLNKISLKTMIYNKAQEKIIKMNLEKQKKNRKKMMKTQKLLNKIMEY